MMMPAALGSGQEGRPALVVAMVLTVLFAAMPVLPQITLFRQLDDYLAAHQAIETFSAVVAMLIFGIGWHAHRYDRPGNFTVLAVSFLGVAALTVCHSMSYTGMPTFITPSGPEKGIAFWLSMRFLAVVGLISAALMPWRPFRWARWHRWLLAFALAFVALVIWGVLWHQDKLPRTFIPGQGLTPLKVVVEIGLSVMFLVAAILFWRRRTISHRHWLAGGSWVMGLSGAFFVLYTNPFDIYNQIGHLYVVVGYGLLYQGLFIGTIHEPYEQLSDSRKLLEQSHAQLEERVSQRTAELRDAVAAADRANQAKSDFLSSMSHELRTPLNAVLGFAQLLQTGRSGPLTEKQSRQLDHIVKGGQHLLDLISEVLDLARIEAGKLSLSVEPVAPAALLDECLALARASAQRSGVTVGDWQVQDHRAVLIDYTRFKQVLLNLMSNAVKYNRPQGTVTLSVAPGAPGYVRFVVTDTGPGIPESHRSELFQPFSRLGAELSEVEGTGIGLTITRRLIEAMDGRIDFSSVMGEGASFWVEVPAAGDLAAPADEASPSSPVSADIGQPFTLLYIEDNPANLHLMQEILADVARARLVSAHTAELGLELALRDRPDIIVLDLNLPGMDGFAALAALKAEEAARPVPVIALTANASVTAQRRAEQAGFDAYLTKPLDIPRFWATLAELLSVSKA
ncbi:putative Response regulator receiver:ATP-binding region, ATPase-like:Histidine kinase A, N-terminal [Magnetospirillum sp. LM-5]|uniref:MASE3 domain-containing protein n=1 Tax=Magnetospirillum sp. LM-5 TaxID=2681466 RepID=UPI001382B99D|nr:MASE3 domain-containing protein [Magnetospirillum sp. LM-5]CAA7620589.1 putative Response regulator receiver:ATP-binding region, ATPase-like:Histidine kinase A, N-terminal [Magnetospirillum sp. LM-5]